MEGTRAARGGGRLCRESPLGLTGQRARRGTVKEEQARPLPFLMLPQHQLFDMGRADAYGRCKQEFLLHWRETPRMHAHHNHLLGVCAQNSAILTLYNFAPRAHAVTQIRLISV